MFRFNKQIVFISLVLAGDIFAKITPPCLPSLFDNEDESEEQFFRNLGISYVDPTVDDDDATPEQVQDIESEYEDSASDDDDVDDTNDDGDEESQDVSSQIILDSEDTDAATELSESDNEVWSLPSSPQRTAPVINRLFDSFQGTSLSPLWRGVGAVVRGTPLRDQMGSPKPGSRPTSAVENSTPSPIPTIVVENSTTSSVSTHPIETPTPWVRPTSISTYLELLVDDEYLTDEGDLGNVPSSNGK